MVDIVLTSSLSLKWLIAASEGRTESGHLLRDNVNDNVTSWFEINTNDGRLRVFRQLDREKAEAIRLVIRVEDTAAATPGQTTSGTMDTNPCFALR